ncbi:MAG: hypothetical protein GXP11_02005 [Gammaproteobacteria bacterium]|nr:hypothetical protein [Gammaproteobacteria bacterium]
MEEKGRLPIGIESEGKVHNEYALREQIVADAVDIFESEDAERATRSDSYYGVCIMARRLSIKGLGREAITPAMLLQMNQLDFNELHAAVGRLDEQRRRFRGKNDASADDASGTA